jgi:uncharacterized membrane protein
MNAKKNQVAPKVPLTARQKALEESIFPESLQIFAPLKPYTLYARHFYTIRYIVKPTIFSASVTMFYTVPWITWFLMTVSFVIDLYLGMKNVIFIKKINNQSVVAENSIFLVISVLYAIILSDRKNPDNRDQKLVGWMIIGLMIAAFISLVVFKVKGKKAL